MRVGRVLLAGDCAHLYSPFGARGLNSGVADAENAAWKIAWVRNGWAPEALLESYHAERHAAALENLAVTSATMDFLVPRGEAAARHRREVLERRRQRPGGARTGRLRTARGAVLVRRLAADDAGPVAAVRRAAGPRHRAPARARDPASGRADRDGTRSGCAHSPGRVCSCWRRPAPTSRRPVASAPASAGRSPCKPLRTSTTLDGGVAQALGARTGELWLVRPDAHVAAVLAAPDEETLRAALRRVLALEATDA